MSKKQIAEVYDNIAGTWSEKVWVKSSDFNHRIVSFSDVKGNESALDVGIGAGDLEDFLGLERVTGVDISKQMLDECRRKHPGFDLHEGDAESLPFPEGRFDFVYCRNFLQNFEDPQKVFSEMYRVLRAGGKLMAVESAVYESERQYVTDIVRVVEPHHALFPSHEQLHNLFKKYGLKNINQRVEGLHKKWLSGFCKSKQATPEQKRRIIEICQGLPESYRNKYQMEFHPSEEEIESTLTFSFIKGVK